MRIKTYTYPQSSFLSLEKDLGILVNLIISNDRLKKLLYYTSKDCLDKPKLTDTQTLDMFGKNIRIVPKLKVDPEVLNYIFINFNAFSQNANNPEFRDNLLEIDILCHFDQWQMKDFELRPFKIAAEIDSMLNNKRLTGIGKLNFVGAEKLMENDEFGGLCLMYRAIHGEEDRKHMPNPNDDEKVIENFDAIFNNQ